MKSNFKKAFTLTELIITMVVLGIIAAIVVPSLISKTTERSKQTKIRKAMANYESTVRNIIAEQQIKTQEELTDVNTDGCAAKVKYFKTVDVDSANPCMFKTADGLWWDITYIENPIVAFKKENLTRDKANGITDYEAFYFATSYYADAKKFIVDDLTLETGANKNYMTKLYGFLNEIERCTDVETCYLSGTYDTSGACNDKTGTCNCTESSGGYYYWENSETVYDGNCKAVQNNYYCTSTGHCEQQCYTEEIPHLANQCAYCYNWGGGEDCSSYNMNECSDDCYCEMYGWGSSAQEAIESQSTMYASCNKTCYTSPLTGDRLCGSGYSECSDESMDYCWYVYTEEPLCEKETTEKCGETIHICYEYDQYNYEWKQSSGNSNFTDDCSARCLTYNGNKACISTDMGIDWDNPNYCYSYSSSWYSYSYDYSYCSYNASKDGMDSYTCTVEAGTYNSSPSLSAYCYGYGTLKDQDGDDVYAECHDDFDASTGKSNYSYCYGYKSYPNTEADEYQDGMCYSDNSSTMTCSPEYIYKSGDNSYYSCYSSGSYCSYYNYNTGTYADMDGCSIVSGKRQCTTCSYGSCDNFKKTDENGNVYYEMFVD